MQRDMQAAREALIENQKIEVDHLKKMENFSIPESFDYSKISGLSAEISTKLQRVRPISVGQAARIPGMTPAALSILTI